MALDKKEASNMPAKLTVKGECYMVTIYKMATILVFPKMAVYFKLNYLKLIHLQVNMLSSLIFTYFAVDHTNLPQNLSFRLRKHKI